MNAGIDKRRSYCISCGKRLSEKTPEGIILWLASEIDDSGIYCEACFLKRATRRKTMLKKNRTKIKKKTAKKKTTKKKVTKKTKKKSITSRVARK